MKRALTIAALYALLIAAVFVLVLVGVPVRVLAQETPRCLDAEVLQRQIAADGGRHFTRVEFETYDGDAIVLFEAGLYAWQFHTRKGCVATWPYIIAYAKDRGEPT
jgi:hypothetical protein